MATHPHRKKYPPTGRKPPVRKTCPSCRPSIGHRFDENLRCEWCGIRFGQHYPPGRPPIACSKVPDT